MPSIEEALHAEAHRGLVASLRAHGLAADSQDDWIRVAGANHPPIQALIFNPRQSGETWRLQLDIRVRLPGDRVLVESFAGWGATAEGALARAFENFARNSLHVLLVAFYGMSDDEQITVERWEVGGQSWNAFLGNFGTQSSAGQPPIPDGLFDAIETCARDAELTEAVHWFRLYYCNLDDQAAPVCEALFDNEPWECADEAVTGLAWRRLASFYSVRHFLVLTRAA